MDTGILLIIGIIVVLIGFVIWSRNRASGSASRSGGFMPTMPASKPVKPPQTTNIEPQAPPRGLPPMQSKPVSPAPPAPQPASVPRQEAKMDDGKMLAPEQESGERAETDKSRAEDVNMPAPEPAPSEQSEIEDILVLEEESDESDIDDLVLPSPQPAAPPASVFPGGVFGGIKVDKPDDNSVQFAAYYPREVTRDEWYPLTAYLYKALFADKIAEDAKKQLGEQLAGMRRMTDTPQQPLTEGAMVTATPVLPGFQVNPPQIQVGFYEDWHRFDFKVRAKDALLNQAANGTLTFSVEGVIVSEVPLAIFVGETISQSADVVNATQKLYSAIFCSYSHADEHIIRRVERAYKALGLDFLRDVHVLKSGQHWDEQLLRLIDQSDIFQLFWSSTASQSSFVEKEWRYALTLLERKANFIRPVYWEQPMPPVPPELSPIHFTYQPDLGE